MSELDEFAEALMGQISVELDEEKEIATLSKKIKDDKDFTIKFDDVENIVQKIFPDLKQKVYDYTGLEISNELSIEYLGVDGFKRLKGKKVFTDNAREFIDK